MNNKHLPHDLAQMQSLPLEAKIRMTQERIRIWYESWKKYTIYNTKTKKTRFVTWNEEPSEKGCYVKKKKKVDGKKVEVDVLVPGTKLKPTEYIEAVEEGQVYVSVSGIDSTVLKHIIDQMYSDVPALYVNTGLEYPEIQKFWKDVKAGKYDCFNSDVEIVRPEMRFDEVIKKYGYPVVSKEVAKKIYEGRQATRNGKIDNYATRQFNGTYVSKNGKTNAYSLERWKFLYESSLPISHKCCDVMKKKPAKQYEKQTGRKPFIGTMASESKLRYNAWLQHGCNAFEKGRPSSQPLSFWTKQDILHYVKKYNVPYVSVYGDIVIDEKIDGNNVIEGQINLIDYLGYYSQEDKLKTTGCDRTGCVYCMFGCHLDGEPNRFQRLKQTHPRQYEYCIGGGEYVWEATYKNSVTGEIQEVSWINDDDSPMTNEQIEEFVERYKNSNIFTFKKVWKPNKKGLGLAKVLDFIGVDYSPIDITPN